MKKVILLLMAMISLTVTAFAANYDKGVERSLADQRKATISDLRYRLNFDIPEDRRSPITGQVAVSFTLAGKQEVVLDFKQSASGVKAVLANGVKAKYTFANEHIVVAKESLKNGHNDITVKFVAGDQSLNRNDEYLYTLLVPERARTLFPCFDQPNMKGRFALTLNIPASWTAVANTKVHMLENDGKRRTITFKPTKPLSTYLFSFVAGKFKTAKRLVEGYSMTAYYRETDKAKIAQLDTIFKQVGAAIKWQEDYTNILYPFGKYDFVILPGFQYGGMEHPGATLFNDRQMFLSNNPTPDEELSRSELIAHEVSHIWFGDLVTMDWFDDVWTKEVFANYYAARISEPLFPNINHQLNWLKSYVAPAQSTDRTRGATAIHQQLDNLKDAGLIYGNAVYYKAPVVMRKIAEIVGDEGFREGMREYLKKYSFGNATWDDLIAILDSKTSADLKEFSREWVDGKDKKTLSLYFEQPDQQRLSWILDNWSGIEDDTQRMGMLMVANESYHTKKITAEVWLKSLIDGLAKEKNALVASSIVGYIPMPLNETAGEKRAAIETDLLAIAKSHQISSCRTQLLRMIAANMTSADVVSYIYNMWKAQSESILDERKYTDIAYELAIRLPHQAKEILAIQRSRISNPDRQRQFDFISRACSSDTLQLDRLFASLLKAENRSIEPWATAALGYLNHFTRDSRSVKYIRPSLDILKEVQLTGDIFMPANWVAALLSGHHCKEAFNEVDTFLNDNPDYPQLLRSKIEQSAYRLYRNYK